MPPDPCASSLVVVLFLLVGMKMLLPRTRIFSKLLRGLCLAVFRRLFLDGPGSPGNSNGRRARNPQMRRLWEVRPHWPDP
jgi:hypothetical protein